MPPEARAAALGEGTSGEGRAPPPGANGSFVLAHLSDPHVPTPYGVGPWSLFNKRIFGYLSWRLRRTHIHRQEVLDALAADLAEDRPDHVAVTGDIVNISLPAEFAGAARWIGRLGPAPSVTVVPGNHDAYVAVLWERSWAAWSAHMSSDPVGEPNGAQAVVRRFPIWRERGPVVVIGLSSALPTPPGWSSGTIGPEQLDRLAAGLQAAGEAGLFRIILLHHPPVTDARRRKQLTDAPALHGVVARYGAELVLHGHEHRPRFASMAGPHGPVPVFGVPSASMLPGETRGGAQYHLHCISPAPGGWHIETRIKAFDPRLGRFVPAATRSTDLPRPRQLSAVPA